MTQHYVNGQSLKMYMSCTLVYTTPHTKMITKQYSAAQHRTAIATSPYPSCCVCVLLEQVSCPHMQRNTYENYSTVNFTDYPFSVILAHPFVTARWVLTTSSNLWVLSGVI